MEERDFRWALEYARAAAQDGYWWGFAAGALVGGFGVFVAALIAYAKAGGG